MQLCCEEEVYWLLMDVLCWEKRTLMDYGERAP